jgi:dipeptidyl-peptidase-4
MTEPTPAVSFPRQTARTQRFTLGAPRAFTPAPDGTRIAFLRSPSGTDRRTCLWVLDVASGSAGTGSASTGSASTGSASSERLVADPADLIGGRDEEFTAEERARRERLREGAGGIVAYATDAAVSVAAFALSGRLWVARLDEPADPALRELPTPGGVVDPRPDPTGRRVAFAADRGLHVTDLDAALDGTQPRLLAREDDPEVVWGLAEFVAAEEMGRHRGYWWAPDGERLLAARVDSTAVRRWWIADPAQPDVTPAEVAYPAAGTPNAEVSLALLDLDGGRTDVGWDRDAFPYLAAVHWSRYGDPLLLVQSRDQRTARVLAVDVASGATRELRTDTDQQWVDLHPGVPAWLHDGRLLHVVAADDTYRLAVDGEPVTPVGLQVSGVLDVDDHAVLLRATTEPTEAHLWRLDLASLRLEALTSTPGLHSGRTAGGLTLVVSSTLNAFGASVVVERQGAAVARIASYADQPVVRPAVTLLRLGQRALRTALLLPTGWEPGQGRLPVLMDPYGGPGAQRVLAARNAYLSSQWLADQGFAVLVVDGRGTPSRGPAWDRAIHHDVAGPVLDDQVAALEAATERFADLDPTRVAIRGWSFGGFLAALAVLRRPDVFHAAVAGAPVTDWALYDTHYTERYLGTPQAEPDVYARTGLLADAAALERPLMIIHGLADDNVVVAHSLRLSAALLAAGRAHSVLPLSGVTHMTPQEAVAENLLLLQVRFLREALGLPVDPPTR